ncbi:cupin domain-containing protein [Kaistia sp. MMO-174]|uniref:cupin domain-containing protein n=1 Tax=Kaistia sp. MMO-174 TaxID=3081256 RepID=UPI001AC8ED57|nr:cupin domain-containing protein [Hyphomicrobiales bacterium]MBN9060000.1 cupin domain-containing protein [Hyphomicrobiales bacterium]
MSSAEEIIGLLGLEPHPEGGYYRRTFEDSVAQDGRPASTAIYYLLAAGMKSHWHRIDAIEVWHYYAGAPIALSLSEDGGVTETHRLGPDLLAGERPQVVVPTGWWQAAESLGDWTLVGCTVAPGFRFEGFELAAPEWAPLDQPERY